MDEISAPAPDERRAGSAPAGASPDFRRVFESAPGPILLIDPDLVMVAASDAYVRTSMIPREELIGRRVFDVFPDNPDDPEASGARNLRASLDRVRRHLVPDVMPVQRYDVRLPPERGGRFEVRYWSPVNAPILGDDGELLYILHRVEDVTEMVRDAQAGAAGDDPIRADAPAPANMWIRARTREAADASRQLKEANLELERLALELAEAGRAADVQHTATLAAEREVRRLKEEFLATVSHELRTPLASVIGYLDLVLEGGYALDPEVADHLEVARRNGQRLDALVADLLLIAQAQAGRLPLARRSVDLSPIVEQAVAAARPAADAAGLRIEHRLAPAAPVDVDPIRVGQLLDNLISNAVKFTPPGGTVRAEIEQRPDCVRVTVADTGVPASPARSARGCSTASSAPAAPSRTGSRAPGSGWPSRRRSPRRTAGRSASSTGATRAARSSWTSRSPAPGALRSSGTGPGRRPRGRGRARRPPRTSAPSRGAIRRRRTGRTRGPAPRR